MNFSISSDQIKARREAAGLTPTQLARNAGLTPRTVWNIERGARDVVQERTVLRLAFALSCGPEDIASDYRPTTYHPFYDPLLWRPPDPLTRRSPDPVASRPPALPFQTPQQICAEEA